MNLDEFLEKTFKGDKAYPTKRQKKWYEFLYLSKYDEENTYKIGHSGDLMQRDNTLSTETTKRDPSKVIYTWNIPFAHQVETLVKRVFKNFIKKEGSDKEGKTEIIRGVPLKPLVLTIRLLVLNIAFEVSYVQPDEIKMEILWKYFQGVTLNAIKYDNTWYTTTGTVTKPFREGTTVRVTYKKKIGNTLPGVYEAKINSYDKTKKNYNVKWLEGNWTNNNVAEQFVTPIIDVNGVERVLDLDEVYNELASVEQSFVDTSLERSSQVVEKLKF